MNARSQVVGISTPVSWRPRFMNIEQKLDVRISYRVGTVIKIGDGLSSFDSAIRRHGCNVDRIAAMILPVIFSRLSVG